MDLEEREAQIYKEYYNKVFQYLVNRMGNQQDAEDLAQTVFVKVYSKFSLFDEGKSSLSTWIFNITRNTLTDHRRSMSYRNHDEITEFIRDEREDVLEELIMEEEQEKLALALDKLNEAERDLIVLHYYKEYTLTDIAKQMQRPYGQVKRLHMKAIDKLKQYMADISG